MRVTKLLATQSGDAEYGELIADAAEASAVRGFDAAVAYATQSGVAELCRILDRVSDWEQARKRWLVGVDYCRSDPKALAHLESLRRSEVRIHDGAFVANRSGCTPRVSFHPKLFMFHSAGLTRCIVGSGNLSYTGLRVGIEAAVSVSCSRAPESRTLLAWYRMRWRAATPLAEVLDAYAMKCAADENRRNPPPSADDIVPTSAGRRGQLTAAQLRQLRVCENLWIQAGNLHLNFGPGRPGNQLMLKRNSRVYFGFDARDVEPDTAIGMIAVDYAGRERPDCSLRFSNNSMDVLTLPIPGAGGPPKYDQELLLFRRTGVRRFALSLGRARDLTEFKRQSRRVNGIFRMRSGREWGVF